MPFKHEAPFRGCVCVYGPLIIIYLFICLFFIFCREEFFRVGLRCFFLLFWGDENFFFLFLLAPLLSAHFFLCFCCVLFLCSVFGRDKEQMDSARKLQRSSFQGNSGRNPRGRLSMHVEQNRQYEFRLTRADVEAAFAFFDVQNKKDLKPRDLKARLTAFYPNMTNKELKFLLESADGNFTVETLWGIIDNYHAMYTSTLTAETLTFDPVKEAFKIYDPQGRGFVDVEVLADIMKRIGLGELSQEELGLLIQTADFDKDGNISLEDFRNLLKIGR
ncbi:hypothetical protein MOQ_002649 [Trypanosoma cruzi marinkellei]|uniref:EF-hand domain-containing protein n=1 Tax=Trypanosoma cruzi marinkellei TaxID=85056 RepID=K2ME41_TRYCR|nr:hypothetical protein MOQ_002649 [Trypanosoma cruzi marinkellei]